MLAGLKNKRLYKSLVLKDFKEEILTAFGELLLRNIILLPKYPLITSFLTAKETRSQFDNFLYVESDAEYTFEHHQGVLKNSNLIGTRTITSLHRLKDSEHQLFAYVHDKHIKRFVMKIGEFKNFYYQAYRSTKNKMEASKPVDFSLMQPTKDYFQAVIFTTDNQAFYVSTALMKYIRTDSYSAWAKLLLKINNVNSKIANIIIYPAFVNPMLAETVCS